MRWFLLMLLFVGNAYAACSGSGTTWTCTAGTTPSQINTTLSSATDGATLTFAAGSYTWGGGTSINPSLTKGVTLICETDPPSSAPWGATTTGGCEVSASGVVLDFPDGVSSKLYRFSGFDITYTGTGNTFHICPGGSCSRTVLTNIRIDHNTITRSSNGTTFMFSDGLTQGYVEGVADKNYIIQPGTVNVFDFFQQADASAVNGRLGTVNNFFIETNTFEQTSGSDDSNGAGCVDGGDGIGVVYRYNTSNDCRALMHGVTHGWGPTNFEVYGNAFSKLSNAALNTGYRLVHHQGSGTFMVFDNTLSQSSGSGHDTDAIVVLHYRAWENGSAGYLCDGNGAVDGNRSPTATYKGYPCNRQPARDVNGTLKPIFVWNNTWVDDGSQVLLECNESVNTVACTNHVVANRDYYNAVSKNAQTSSTSPFNGSTGMGFGTRANRPTSCTTTTESADAGNGGVGYWATDAGGNWNTTNGNSNDGCLDMCTATNTWTNCWYTPHTYPYASSGSSSNTTKIILFRTIASGLISIGLLAGGLYYARRNHRTGRNFGRGFSHARIQHDPG